MALPQEHVLILGNKNYDIRAAEKSLNQKEHFQE